MSVNLNHSDALDAYVALQNSGTRGCELANLLDQRGTHVRVTNKIVGGFALNFINTIFLQTLRADASEWEFKAWVTLLAHEACHIEQNFWADSIQQEIRAYKTQAAVGDELGIDLGYIKQAFADLNPENAEHQRLARAAMLNLFAGTPAGIVYASLPLIQPIGVRAILPALGEIATLVRAARHTGK